ncbi:hypothetical protein ABEB36_012330 [Hypothenemus hampei]|uniref:Uncharacterized protein n=1 Tax=Hypothenemus hampei TaxID=57062 RepID=A0ABD1EF62_HYPHA
MAVLIVRSWLSQDSSQFYMISSHNETHPGTPPTSAATSPSLPSSPPPSSTISVEGSVDGPVTGSVDGIKLPFRYPPLGRILSGEYVSVGNAHVGADGPFSSTTEQLLKDAISHYSDLRKTGANPDYDHIQKKAHFSSTLV